jgi:hypothetical protein
MLPESVMLGACELAVVSSVGTNETTDEDEAETLGKPINIDTKRSIDTARHRIVFFISSLPLLFSCKKTNTSEEVKYTCGNLLQNILYLEKSRQLP